jgi:biopolymer transport protein TolR
MAGGLSALPGERNAGGWRRRKLASEINVTPFVDVMLVLLIVFMVAAPLMTVGVPIDLPQAKAPEIKPQTKPVAVFIDKDKRIYVGETETDLLHLARAIDDTTQGDKEERVHIRADKAVDYGMIMEVMSAISSAGYAKIGLVTKPQDKAP